jgi:uncharacterized protein YjbJ (UPF0337 family)
MASPEQNKVEGKIDDAKGRGKMAVGDLTDNDQLKDEGAMDRMTGAVKQSVGDVKDKVSDLADKVSDKVKNA